DIARLECAPGNAHGAGGVVYAQRAGAGNAGLAHAARHHGGVRGHAPAGGEVLPPGVGRMPSAACIPWMSSGEVSTRTRMTFLSLALSASASSEENTISPDAAPGEAGSPVAMILR